MISKEDFEKIKRIVKELFQKMTVEGEIEVLPLEGETLPINLKVEDPQILIGEKGQTLFEIQHILKIIFRREILENFYVDLDINDYKKRKIEYLKEMARSVADEVALTKEEKVLSSMPAYERRIIHLEIAERHDVTSESIGEGPERRVVIKPLTPK
jgi:spoIIIJ-associated protein